MHNNDIEFKNPDPSLNKKDSNEVNLPKDKAVIDEEEVKSMPTIGQIESIHPALAYEQQDDRDPQSMFNYRKLKSWLNKSMRIEMSDGRKLVGIFLCTDRDANVILGSCLEYMPKPADGDGCSWTSAAYEPRTLGLAMIPGHHIRKIQIDGKFLQQPTVNHPHYS